jgi:hypothetical protein
MKTSAALAVALGVLVSTASITPARADPATVWLVTGIVLGASTVKCAISPNARAIDSLCWLSPLTYVAAATAIAAPRGTITVKARKAKKKK